MFRIYLSINDEKRQILSLHYEYFHPVYKSEDEYRKTLYKNYPYKFEDKYDLSPYRDYELPVLGNGPLDSHLAYEAKQTVSEIQTGGYWSRDKSNREMYYDALTRLRYGKRLDRGIIPNLNHLYDMELRPSEAPGRHWSDIVIGGHFSLLLESTDNDLFFYEWLSTGRLHQGELQVFTGDSGNYFRIRFWDCYCVGVGEQMSALSACPMLMSLYLSPAIVENRGVKFEKIWKKTEIKREPFKAEVVAVPYEKTDKPKVQIKEAYWIDEEGEVQRDSFPDNPVTLYVKLMDDTVAGQTVELHFEVQEDEGCKSVIYSGTVNNDGLILLEDFKFEIEQKEIE